MRAKIFYLLLLMFLATAMTSCVSVRVKSKPHKENTIPPGQAKKIVGSKSAKPFAPGQRKKW